MLPMVPVSPVGGWGTVTYLADTAEWLTLTQGRELLGHPDVHHGNRAPYCVGI